MRHVRQMISIVAAIAFMASDGRGQDNSSLDLEPFGGNVVKGRAISSDNASSLIKASLLVLEMDWSKSPTAKEVEIELQTAFKDLTLEPVQRQKLLVTGPSILFDREKVIYYTHDHLNGLISWLDHHKLIKGRIDGAQATSHNVQVESPGRMSEKRGMVRSNARMEEEISRPRACVVIRDENLLPLPEHSPKLGPFVKFSHRKFWLVNATSTKPINLLTGLPTLNVISRLAYSAEQREWGTPSNDKVERIKDSINNSFLLPPGQTAIVSGGGPTNGKSILRSWMSSLPAQGTLPILVISWEGIDGAQPAFHLPDKVKILTELAGPSGNEEIEIVTNEPMDALANVIPPTNTPSRSPDADASPLQTPDSPNIHPVVVIPQVPSEGRASELTGVTSAVPTSTTDLKRDYEAKENRILEMALDLQQNPAKEKELDEKLRTEVTEAFAIRQRLHQAELSEFQLRMQKIQALIQTRDKMKDQIIERRLQDLRQPNLKWDASKHEKQKVPNAKGKINLPETSEFQQRLEPADVGQQARFYVGMTR